MSQSLVDRVTPIGHETWENKLILCLDPKHLVYINFRAFLTKLVSQDLMHSFSGLIAPGNCLFQHKAAPASRIVSGLSHAGEAGSQEIKRLYR